MEKKATKVGQRLLRRMRDLEKRWGERDTAEVWDKTTPVPVEPSTKRPAYLIAVKGRLAKALQTAANRNGESVPDYARRVLACSLETDG
jgi:hypothetical protein